MQKREGRDRTQREMRVALYGGFPDREQRPGPPPSATPHLSIPACPPYPAIEIPLPSRSLAANGILIAQLSLTASPLHRHPTFRRFARAARASRTWPMPRYRRASSHAPTRDRAGMMSLASALLQDLLASLHLLIFPRFRVINDSVTIGTPLPLCARYLDAPRTPSSSPSFPSIVQRPSYHRDRAAQSETGQFTAHAAPRLGRKR